MQLIDLSVGLSQAGVRDRPGRLKGGDEVAVPWWHSRKSWRHLKSNFVLWSGVHVQLCDALSWVRRRRGVRGAPADSGPVEVADAGGAGETDGGAQFVTEDV